MQNFKPTQITVFTIVPSLFPGPLGESIFYNAMQDGKFSIKTINLRDFAKHHYNRVDDYPFGGGAGLVMKADVLSMAIEAELLNQNITYNHQNGNYFDASTNQELCKYHAPLILVPSAKGYPFNNDIALELGKFTNLFFVCGRFEGIDQRFISYYKAIELSIGNYVLAGGETAVFAMCEAVLRLKDGIMGNKLTKQEESFAIKDENGNELKEYNHYTRPAMWKDLSVPPVLLSGNHALVAKWRLEEAKYNTAKAQTPPNLLIDNGKC